MGVLVALIIVLAGCGTATSRLAALDEAVADVEVGDTPVTETDLDVFLEAAEVRGAEGLTVERYPVGTLREGKQLWVQLRFRSERQTSISGLINFGGTGQREGGGAELGMTGTCGLGWAPDGQPRTGEACIAVSYADAVLPDYPLPVLTVLYSITESGPVTAGRYHLTVPLDKGPALELTFVLVELPPWPGETMAVRYGFELHPRNAWRELRIRIEDGYGRVLEELDIAERRNTERGGVFTVDLPLGEPWHFILLRHDGTAWVPCGRDMDLVTGDEEERDWPTTLITDVCVSR